MTVPRLCPGQPKLKPKPPRATHTFPTTPPLPPVPVIPLISAISTPLPRIIPSFTILPPVLSSRVPHLAVLPLSYGRSLHICVFSVHLRRVVCGGCPDEAGRNTTRSVDDPSLCDACIPSGRARPTTVLTCIWCSNQISRFSRCKLNLPFPLHLASYANPLDLCPASLQESKIHRHKKSVNCSRLSEAHVQPRKIGYQKPK